MYFHLNCSVGDVLSSINWKHFGILRVTISAFRGCLHVRKKAFM